MSVARTFLRTLRRSSEDFIAQTEIIEEVSRKTGISYESVRGSCCKSHYPGAYSLEAQEETGYYPVPRRLGRNAGFQRGAPRFAVSYDCPRKQQVRTRIVDKLREVFKGESPRILTFGGAEGLDVKYFKGVFPSAFVMNIERDADTMAAFINGHPNHPWRFQGEFKDFYLVPGQYDLINFDSCAYLCKSVAEDLTRINQIGAAEALVAVTLQYSKNFRNHGPWVDSAREKYKEYDDPNRACVEELLSNYTLRSTLKYRKSNVSSSKAMRTFLFTRRT